VCAPNHFDQWEQVYRIEGMADEDPLGMATAHLYPSGQQTGRAGSDEDIRRSNGVNLGQQAPLQILTLGCIFLHKVGIGDRLVEISVKAEPLLACPSG
jgi:hypothetical protein